MTTITELLTLEYQNLSSASSLAARININECVDVALRQALEQSLNLSLNYNFNNKQVISLFTNNLYIIICEEKKKIEGNIIEYYYNNNIDKKIDKEVEKVLKILFNLKSGRISFKDFLKKINKGGLVYLSNVYFKSNANKLALLK